MAEAGDHHSYVLRVRQEGAGDGGHRLFVRVHYVNGGGISHFSSLASAFTHITESVEFNVLAPRRPH